MADPFTGAPTSTAPYTTDPFIAGLLNENFTRWGNGSDTTLSYSFPWTTSGTAQWGTDYGNGELEATSYFGLNSTQMAAVDNALSAWSDVIDVDFVKTYETDTSVGDLRFAFTSSREGEDAWGWAYYPSDYWPSGGDVWINTDYASETDWSKSSYNFFSLLHEIGHALGLEHPFNSSDGDSYSSAYDTRNSTVMSYTNPENVWAWDSSTKQGIWTIQSPMVYDILAAQHMYGANWEHNAGNNIYTFDPTEEVRKTIWDGGGQDTFDFSNFALDLAVDLTPGSYSDVPVPGWDATQNIGIAFEAFIETVIGGSGNDDLSGNSVGNTLAGGAGNDTLAGGGGSDTFSFSGLFGADTISDFSVGEDSVALLGSDGLELKGISNLLNIKTTPDGDARIIADISDEGISGSITLLGVTADAAEGIFATLGETIIGTSAGDILNGSSGADLIESKAGDDTVEGSKGDDKIDGGTGRDTVIYSGNQTSYTLTLGPTSTSLTDRRTDGSGTDTLIDMEFLDFDTDLLGGPFDLTTFGGTDELSAPEFESFIELYIAYFNRAPDAVGLNFWGTAFATGTTLEDMATLFIDQDETLAAYPAGTTNEEFANTVYGNVLGRTPDAAGFDFWVGQLDSDNVSRDQFILEVLRGVKDGTPDRGYLDDKVDLGAYFAVHKGMSNTENAASAIDLFDAAGVDAAVAAIDGYYADAQDSDTGEFLMPVVGVLDDPFHLA